MALKSSTNYLNFQVTDVGDKSKMGFYLNNPDFDKATHDLTLDAPFQFNRCDETTGLHSMPNAEFKNSWHDETGTIIDLLVHGEYTLILVIEDDDSLTLSSFITSTGARVVYKTFVGSESGDASPTNCRGRKLIASGDTVYVLYNMSAGSVYKDVRVKCCSISDQSAFPHTVLSWSDTTASTASFRGFDLIMFEKEHDGTSDFFERNMFVHGEFNTGGGDPLARSVIFYKNTWEVLLNASRSPIEGLSYACDGYLESDARVFNITGLEGRRDIATISYSVENDGWSPLNRYSFDSISGSSHSEGVLSPQESPYVFHTLSKSIVKTDKTIAFSSVGGDTFFDYIAIRGDGTGHNASLNNPLWMKIDFKFDEIPSVGSVLFSTDAWKLVYSSGFKIKVCTTDDITTYIETVSTFEFDIYTRNTIELLISSTSNDESFMKINGGEITITASNVFDLRWSYFIASEHRTYYSIFASPSSMTTEWGFNNILDPFNGFYYSGTTRGSVVNGKIDDTTEVDIGGSASVIRADSQNVYFLSDDRYFHIPINNFIADAFKGIVYTTASDFACFDIDSSSLHIGSNLGAECSITKVNSATGSLTTQDNSFWIEFAPTAVGNYTGSFLADSSLKVFCIGTAIEAVATDDREYAVVKTNTGNKDFQKKGDFSNRYIFVHDSGGEYYYDNNSGMFLTVKNSDFDRVSVSCYRQDSEDLFEAYFDTINILFEPKRFDGAMTDSNIKLFIKAACSMARIEVQYTSDGNYEFGTDKEYGTLGEDSETASFENEEVCYVGKKQVEIKEVITDQREARSIKLRVFAKLTDDDGTTPRIDDFKVFNINILAEGKIVINGGDNG